MQAVLFVRRILGPLVLLSYSVFIMLAFVEGHDDTPREAVNTTATFVVDTLSSWWALWQTLLIAVWLIATPVYGVYLTKTRAHETRWASLLWLVMFIALIAVLRQPVELSDTGTASSPPYIVLLLGGWVLMTPVLVVILDLVLPPWGRLPVLEGLLGKPKDG